VVKSAVSKTTDFVLVDKACMTEVNSGNKRVVSVTPFFNLVGRPTLMYSVTTTRDIAQMEFTLPRIRDLASYVTFPIE
jgi:hypothetical protein